MKPCIKKTLFHQRKLKIVIAGILVVVLVMLYIIFNTPYFCAMLVRAVFANPEQYPPMNHQQIAQSVTIHNDIEYPSKYGSNVLDIYLPKYASQPLPTIIFAHSGGYVGGDKQETRYFATSLAANGYAVVSINYERAPQANYPIPLIQLGEVYEFIKSDTIYKFDATNLIFAGSSAGAHCVAQFVTIQSSKEYADLLEIEQTVPTKDITSVLLYCGPYDFELFGARSSAIMNFIMDRTMWAYYGTYHWRDRYGHLATLKHHVTPSFPPTFITDGNTYSFEYDGMELAQSLQDIGVPVTSFFVDIDDEAVGHEFQYDMQSPAAEKVFILTMDFLNAYAK